MKIKDLPKQTNLGGVKVKTPSGQVGYWVSQWRRGVWLSETKTAGKAHPVFLEDLKEVLEWEVLEK